MISIPELLPDKTETLYGSDLIVKYLSDLGISYVAFNPGATFRGIHDSLVNSKDEGAPEIIECTHEGISVAIAHGYAKASGKPMGVLLHNVVGLMHGSMAIFNAWCDRVPMLLLGGTGPMDVSVRRPGIDWIHTALVQGNLVRDYVKWDDQPYSLVGVLESLLRGYRVSMSEPRGPIYLCYDVTLQEQEVVENPNLAASSKAYTMPLSPQISSETLLEIAKLLIRSRKVVAIGDLVGRDPVAFDALTELAELLGMPVIEPEKRVNSLNFPTCHDLNLTGANEEMLADADLVLALEVDDLFGVLNKLEKRTGQYRSMVESNTKIINIGLKDLQRNSWVQGYQRNQPFDISVPSSMSHALPELLKTCRQLLSDGREDWRNNRRIQLTTRHHGLRAKWREEAVNDGNKEVITRPFLAFQLWELIKEYDWVLANGSLKGWAQKLWDFSKSQQWLGVSGGSGLGYGIGAALGAALAYRDTDKLILNLQADGDFLFTPSALWTAAHYRLPVLIVMDNNRKYGNTYTHQSIVAETRGRALTNASIGTTLDDPVVDFALLARSFGIYGEGPITSPNKVKLSLERALQVVIKERRPALIDIVMGGEQGVS